MARSATSRWAGKCGIPGGPARLVNLAGCSQHKEGEEKVLAEFTWTGEPDLWLGRLFEVK